MSDSASTTIAAAFCDHGLLASAALIVSNPAQLVIVLSHYPLLLQSIMHQTEHNRYLALWAFGHLIKQDPT